MATARAPAARGKVAELWFHRYRKLYAVGGLVWLVRTRHLAFAACPGLVVALLGSCCDRAGRRRRDEGAGREGGR